MLKFLKRKPKSYFVPERGCLNCEHVFVELEHDSGNNYYCTFRSSPRPLCGSCAMHEAWCNKEGRMTDRAFAKGMRLWEAWSGGREVEPWGICDEFKHREEET